MVPKHITQDLLSQHRPGTGHSPCWLIYYFAFAYITKGFILLVPVLLCETSHLEGQVCPQLASAISRVVAVMLQGKILILYVIDIRFAEV